MIKPLNPMFMSFLFKSNISKSIKNGIKISKSQITCFWIRRKVDNNPNTQTHCTSTHFLNGSNEGEVCKNRTWNADYLHSQNDAFYFLFHFSTSYWQKKRILIHRVKFFSFLFTKIERKISQINSHEHLNCVDLITSVEKKNLVTGWFCNILSRFSFLL